MAYNLEKAKRNAKRIGVDVKASTRKGKKLDVLKQGKKVASIGAVDYDDYTVHGDKKRKTNYKKRHDKYRHKKGTPSYYADQILWT
jgi:hypothetical protein